MYWRITGFVEDIHISVIIFDQKTNTFEIIFEDSVMNWAKATTDTSVDVDIFTTRISLEIQFSFFFVIFEYLRISLISLSGEC